ncbi:hypothetical protein ACJMK2_030843, partial [Sinanodonta woodiana]
EYSFQCYFRQRWYDERLNFRIRNISEITLNNLFLYHIWKPNTYFINGRKSYQHNITVPNLFVRIREDGRVYLSRRVTIRASCPMKLSMYPMDKPTCPLIIGSYGYTTKDVLYVWKYGNDKSVDRYDDLSMAQFDLVGIHCRNVTRNTTMGEEYSMLEVFIHFERHLGFFILQTYLPCSMITCLSFVSFWIHRDAAPGRVFLGVMTILATAGIGMNAREGFPRISYPTCLDLYLNVCVAFEMFAMIEYALVNYFTKALPKDIKEEDDDENQALIFPENPSILPPGLIEQDPERIDMFNNSLRYNERRNCKWFSLCLICLSGNMTYRSSLTQKADAEKGNSISRIDVLSRCLFPSMFLAFNCIYWFWYLYLGKTHRYMIA